MHVKDKTDFPRKSSVPGYTVYSLPRTGSDIYSPARLYQFGAFNSVFFPIRLLTIRPLGLLGPRGHLFSPVRRKAYHNVQ